MESLQDTSVKHVFSTLRENFTTSELEILECDIDQLLTSSESIEHLIRQVKELLLNKRLIAAV